MRILHVIPSLAPCHGGPSVVLPIMERALAAVGVEVETLTTDDDGPGSRNTKGDGTARRENGVIRRYFRKQTEFYKVSLPLAAWLGREVSNYDLVHVHALFSHTSVAACRAARAAGVPYIIRPLGVLTRYGVTQRRAMLKRLCLKWVEGPLLRDAAAVHFTMAMEQAEAEQLGIPFRSVVVPLGLEAQPLPEPTPDREAIVLFLSRIDPKKNIEGLLEAWAEVSDQWTVISDQMSEKPRGLGEVLDRSERDVPRRGERAGGRANQLGGQRSEVGGRKNPEGSEGFWTGANATCPAGVSERAGERINSEIGDWRLKMGSQWKLVIAGSGMSGYEASLKAKAEGLGISGSVEWAGQVAGQRKAQLLADAEIFVLPSFSENFGIAAAEALLAGKACLFSPGVAAGAEAASHGAACLAGPDSATLAGTLAALMDSAADRARLSVQARIYSERELSAGVMATRLKALYEAILAGSNPPPHS